MFKKITDKIRIWWFIRNIEKKKPYKPKIVIDSSGASTWANMLDYWISDEGRKELKEMSKFAEKLGLHQSHLN